MILEIRLKNRKADENYDFGFLKLIPVYEKEEHNPILLIPLLNVKFTKDDLGGFIKELYDEILRE